MHHRFQGRAVDKDTGAAAFHGRACTRLWQAVLGQALRDIFRTAVSKYGCDELDRRAAIAWVGTSDFHRVCALAGVDGPSAAQAIARRLEQQLRGDFDPTCFFHARGESSPRYKPAVRRAGA